MSSLNPIMGRNGSQKLKDGANIFNDAPAVPQNKIMKSEIEITL